MQSNNNPADFPEGQPNQPPISPSKSNKTLIIFSSIIVFVVLIVVSFLVFGNSDSDQQDVSEESGNTEKQTTNSDADENDGDVSTTSTEDPSEPNGNPPADTADVSGFIPQLPSLSLSVDESEAGQSIAGSGVTREMFVTELEAVGISESQVADFLDAYDLITSEEILQKISTEMTDQQKAELEERVAELVANEYLHDVFSCDLTAENLDTDCIAEALNGLGQGVMVILQDFGLV